MSQLITYFWRASGHILMNKWITNISQNKMPEISNADGAEALTGFRGMHTCSPLMLEIFEWLKKAATANVPVYIWGETGAGKELTARALHEESGRNTSPFLSYNCANFSDSLMDSQLFGHRKGSFTGAVADQTGLLGAVAEGTLFMDEVTTMDISLQAKLLRVLQEREYLERIFVTV
jgi:two-component system repressor protein LuxO